MKNFYDIANIEFAQGTLVVDTTSCSFLGKHYNVSITVENGTINIEAEKAMYGICTNPNEEDVEEVTESSIEYYRQYLFFGPLKKRIKNFVEYKKRKKVKYLSNNWTIKTN